MVSGSDLGTAARKVFLYLPLAVAHRAPAGPPNYDQTSGLASCTLFTIPAGAQVVVETVGCTAEVAAGQGPAQADLVVPNVPYGAPPASGASEYLFNLAMTKQTNSSSGVDIWGMTNQVLSMAAHRREGASI